MLTGPGETVRRARRLRREMTLPEILLWQALRQRPGGLKFRHQHPAGPYALDFFCASTKLAIEVDGQAHDTDERAAKDRARDAWVASRGVRTIRIPAVDVLRDVAAVIDHIVASATPDQPLHRPADGLPPRAGEEQATPPRHGEGDHAKRGGGAEPSNRKPRNPT